ncbi:MAG: hypothetical protein KC609_19020, partial [Myxococcales bacterium]|nr:hypothetical protein [Myxococcales bacterium]
RLRQWFLNPRLEGRISDELLLDLFEDHRSQPLVRYLLARRLLERRRYAAASRLLQTLTIESLPSDDFGFEAYRVWGEALYFLGRYGEAERLFERLAQQYASQPEGVRRQVDEWRARCRWRQLHRTRAGLFFFGPGLFHWLRQVRAS